MIRSSGCVVHAAGRTASRCPGLRALGGPSGCSARLQSTVCCWDLALVVDCRAVGAPGFAAALHCQSTLNLWSARREKLPVFSVRTSIKPDLPVWTWSPSYGYIINVNQSLVDSHSGYLWVSIIRSNIAVTILHLFFAR